MTAFSAVRHRVLAAVLSMLVLTATAWAGPMDSLPQLAEQGQFNQVLALLQQQQDLQPSEPVADLLQDVQRHLSHQDKLRTEREEAYTTAIKNLQEQLAANKLEEALRHAVEAQLLTHDHAALLQHPQVSELVTRAQQAAQEAANTGSWIEALNLYRALDVLFDDQATYHDHVSRTQRHVRILRMYAPDQFQKLLEEQIRLHAAADQEKPEPLNLGQETWEQMLEGVEIDMFKQALDYAAASHVSGGGYRDMFIGALDALVVLLDTPGLDKTFPTLAQADQLMSFRQTLTRVHAEALRRKGLNILDVSRLIDQVAQANQRTIKLPEQVLVYEMTDGAMEKLDEFSNVIWPVEKEAFARNTRGKFFGVGIQIARTNGQLTVVTPIPNTPAHRAKLQPGDVIAQVNGQDTSAWSLDQAVREITGPEGTQVTLLIKRVGETEPLPVKLTRAEIPIESIRGWQPTPGGGWDYMIDPDLGIGYVRMSQFIPQTADDLDAAINQMQAQGGVRGLILDLRFNPGGLLSAAVEVSDRFIERGPIVSTVDARGQDTHPPLSARPQKTYPNFPVVVLINESSASASEIVSGALQDYQRALVIGARSFGKGSVQDLFGIDRGKAYLKLTTQYYKLPKGRIIHRKPKAKVWGIEPNVVVTMTPQEIEKAMEFRRDLDILREEPAAGQEAKPAPTAQQILEEGMDPQLDVALLVLRSKLTAQQVLMAQGEAAPIGQ